MKIKIDVLKQLIERNFYDKNVSEEVTKKAVDYLIWVEMCGKKTQGIVKMFGTEPLQSIVPQHDIKIERETPCSSLINAGANNSIYTSQIATDIVIKKAKEVGMAIVGVRNTFSSNGAQAYYLEQICKEGLIAFSCCRSPGAIAPFNSIDPLFGTNPVAFGFPTNEESIIFDMASSAITFYGLIVADHKGEKIDPNLSMDNKGDMTIDPKEAMNGAIYPFDKGYKGSNLAMMVELLSGPLLNSSYCDYKTFEEEWGSTFIAIDPNILLDLEDFKAKSSDMVRMIKEARSKNGESIRLPGEESRKNYEEALKTGELDIDKIYLEKLGYKF